MATASAAQAAIPSRVRRSVEANPHEPCAIDANADAERFRFGERADLAVFCGKIAVADVHDARVGVGRAAQLRGFKRPVGEVPHHGVREAKTKNF